MKSAIIILAFCASAFAQKFEVASIKPAPPDDGTNMVRIHGGVGSSDPGHITIQNASLMVLLTCAYPRMYRIYGPTWLDQDKFDLIATMPADTTKEQFAMMMRSLLAERFGVKAHQGRREFASYDLVIAKSGFKLRESVDDPNPPHAAQEGVADLDNDGFPILTKPGMVTIFRKLGGRMTAKAQPMSRLAQNIGSELDKPVTDKTGLTGKYDFKLEYTPIRMMSASSAPGDAELGVGGITYAIKALGLTLVDSKTTLDVEVIDHTERTPTEN
jgi:uncharacterized protein (TIGR03435 family)